MWEYKQHNLKILGSLEHVPGAIMQEELWGLASGCFVAICNKMSMRGKKKYFFQSARIVAYLTKTNH